MIKVIIFDYYGVIAQDAFWYQVKGLEATNHKSEYIEKLSNEVNLNKISWEEFCAVVSRDINISIEEVKKRYAEHKIKPGIVELITKLKQKYKIALLSNASSNQLLVAMRHLGLDKLFDETLISSDIGLIKPDSKAFLYMAKKMEVEASECVMIDDVAGNVEAAKSVGMQGIIFEDSESCSKQLQDLIGD